MPRGPGRYDDIATEIRHRLKAAGVILLVIDGKGGQGFSVQLPRHLIEVMPEMLETIAREIRVSGADG